MRQYLGSLVVALVLFAPVALLAQQTYADQATLAGDQTFMARVKIAAFQYALNNVSVEDPATPLHAERVALANKIIQNPDALARQLALGVVADLTFTQASTDGAIFSRVAFIWNAYATAGL